MDELETGLNDRAWTLSEEMRGRAEELRVRATRLDGGARVLDLGVEAAGGLEAGRRLAEICMGGLGAVRLAHVDLDGWWLPAVEVATDHPALACMAAQYAGWQVSVGDYFAMGSGPARAAVRAETELYDALEYGEEPERAVLVLEGAEVPDEEVASRVAERAGVDPSGLALLVAPTSSLAGGVQVCARSVETGMHQMVERGYDVRRVVSAFGTAPLAPVAGDDLEAMGRTNDCVLYGGRVHYTVDDEDAALEELASLLPSSRSPDHGRPFREVFESHDHDFYEIDPSLFSPAEIWITSARSGRSFREGKIAVEVLRRSLLG